jgi:hypothetical protein
MNDASFNIAFAAYKTSPFMLLHGGMLQLPRRYLCLHAMGCRYILKSFRQEDDGQRCTDFSDRAPPTLLAQGILQEYIVSYYI